MGEHELSELCREKFRQMDEHVRESPVFRDNVTKHGEQILTLERAREETMRDIKAIREDMTEIKDDIKDLKGDVKIWVLSGVVGTVMAFAIPTMTLFYNAGQMQKQLDVNTSRWERSIEGTNPK